MHHFDLGIGIPTVDGLPELPPLRTAVDKSGIVEHMMARSIATGGGMYGTTGTWTQRRLEQVRHYRLWTRKAIDKLCTEIRKHRPMVGWVTNRTNPTPQHHGYHGFHKSHSADYRYRKTLQAIHPHEEIEPCPPNHPLCRLMEHPNDWDTGGLGEVLYELWMMMELTGTGYLWCPPDPLTGLPCEMIVIPSHWVHTRLNRAGIWYYQIIPVVGMNNWFIPEEEVVYLKYKSPIHKIDGWSPMQASSEMTDLQDSMFFSWYSMLKNGCFPAGVATLPEGWDDPNDPAIDRLSAKFASRYQGEGKFGVPLWMANKMTYTQLKINPDEFAFIESAEFIRDQILANHDVPKQLVGIDTGGSSTEVAPWGAIFVFYHGGVNPRLAYTGIVLTNCLATKFRDPTLRIWWPDNTPPNPQQRNADAQLLATSNAISLDELRHLYDMEPLPDGLGEYPLVPTTLVPLSDLEEQQDVQNEMQMASLFNDDEEDDDAPQKPAGDKKPKDEKPKEKPKDEPEEKGVRPEVTRALAAVSANGHENGNGHAAPLLPQKREEDVSVGTYVPTETPGSVKMHDAVPPTVSPGTVEPPARPKRRKSNVERRFLADLMAGWVAPPAPVEPRVASLGDSDRIEVSLLRPRKPGVTEKTVRLPDGRTLEIKETFEAHER